METIIDDFTTGRHPIEPWFTDDPKRGVQNGSTLGGSRRTVVTLDTRNSHGPPITFHLGIADFVGLHVTVPVEASATMGLFYGEAGGVRVDWSQAEAMLVDIAAYTSFLR